jgi:putative ABC transport system ATP-binding protein
VTCIIGSSGSGKSTILRAIAGLHQDYTGNIRVCGVDLQSVSSKGLVELRRKTVTTVDQEYNLLDTLTAKENVVLGLELAGERGAADAADYWIDRLGLAEVSGEFPATLSGGEKQRVAIARSLASPHPVVLADEPTGALDEENSRAVIDLMRYFATIGKCCIVVTHDLSVAEAADRVLALKDATLA